PYLYTLSLHDALPIFFRAENQMLYGADHPLALSAGGWPASIRQMKAEDIRKFHSDNYHLANMGMVASFPKEMPLGDTLQRLDDRSEEHTSELQSLAYL